MTFREALHRLCVEARAIATGRWKDVSLPRPLRALRRQLSRAGKRIRSLPWPSFGGWAAWLGGWALLGVPVVHLALPILPWWATSAGWAGVFVLGVGGYGSLAALFWDGVLVLRKDGEPQ